MRVLEMSVISNLIKQWTTPFLIIIQKGRQSHTSVRPVSSEYRSEIRNQQAA